MFGLGDKKIEGKVVPFEQLNYQEPILEAIDYSEYTDEQLKLIENAAYERNRDEQLNYIRNLDAPSSSPDCPTVIGMENVSRILVYHRGMNAWLLTDGMGNGWIR